MPMGLTAEKVADRYGVTREAMDAFPNLSQHRAVAAQEAGAVAAQEAGSLHLEIAPYHLPDGRLVRRDDGPPSGRRWR